MHKLASWARWLREWAVRNGVSFSPMVSAADVVGMPHSMLRLHKGMGRALTLAGPSVIIGWATDDQAELRFFTMSDLSQVVDLVRGVKPSSSRWAYSTEIAFSTDSTRITIGLDERLLELDAKTGGCIAVHAAPGQLSSVAPGHGVRGWLIVGIADLYEAGREHAIDT